MSLETDLQNAIAAQNQLTQTIAQWHNKIKAEHEQQKQDYERWKASMLSRMPVAPNLVPDTRHFKSFCGGALKTPKKLGESGAVATPWACGWDASGVQADVTFEVVPWQDTRLDELGFGDRSAVQPTALPGSLVPANGYGLNFNVLVITLNVRSVPKACTFLGSVAAGKVSYTGWNVGKFPIYSSAMGAFTGTGGVNQGLVFGGNFLPGVTFTEAAWTHKTAVRENIGGVHQHIRIQATGAGTCKAAIALPYGGTGDHGGIPVWAGAITDGQGIPYTHTDIVISAVGAAA